MVYGNLYVSANIRVFCKMQKFILGAWKKGASVIMLTFRDVTASRQSKRACSALDFRNVGIAFGSQRDERRGVECGDEQRRVVEQRSVLLDVQPGRGELDIALAVGRIVVVGHDAALVASLHKGLETVGCASAALARKSK